MWDVNSRNMYRCLQKCNKLNKSHLDGQLLNSIHDARTHVYKKTVRRFPGIFFFVKMDNEELELGKGITDTGKFNPLTPNDHCSGLTASLTSKRCISCIYSTNIGTAYFKHGIYSPCFSLQNAVCFIILTYLVPVLFRFYVQGVLKLKKNNFGAKRLSVGNLKFPVSQQPQTW